MPGCNSAVKTSAPANFALNELMMLRGIGLAVRFLALARLHDVRDQRLDLDDLADLGLFGKPDARL